MHDCLDVQDWIKVWGDSDDDRRQLADCERCWPLREDVTAWAEAVAGCDDCQSVLDASPSSEEISGCSACMESLARLHETVEGLEHFDPVVAPELLSAAELAGKLEALTPGARIARVTDDLRYQQWGLAQHLLAISRELWVTDPEAAREQAVVAAAVADLLDPSTYHPRWVADLRAKAHAYLANTHRILGAFREAEREFLVAESYIATGTSRGRARATVFSLKASLLLDQGRFVEAALLLGFVMAHHAAVGEDEAVARTCLKMAIVEENREDFAAAAALCAQAQTHLDPDRDHRLWVLALQNAAEYTVAAGDIERARKLFDELPPAVDQTMVLRRLWMEGNLHRAEGAHGSARMAYDAARSGMTKAGLHYLAALVSLEEAAMALDEGDNFEALTMAQEASILLVRGAARQEALAVLRVLLTALERGAADHALVTTLARRIAKLQPSG